MTVDGGNPNTFTQGNGETNPSADITMSGYQGTIAITNAYTRLLDLKIIKVDVNGMTKLLEGARFELRKVDPDKATLSYLDDAMFIFTASSGDTPAEAKVGNEPGAALPSTGGPGTKLIYFLGIMLICLAGAGLMMRKRRKML